MDAAKEKVLNIGATAKAGMDKTKATAEEKIERMKTRDPLQKEVAEGRKLEKIHQAELAKQQAYKENAIQKGEGEGEAEAHHIGAGHQTCLGGNHAGVGHQAGLGGHRTAVGHQTGLDEPTNGGTGLQRTDAPIVDTKTI
ncbi:hypothetical protein KFK09_014800 [Dendrobium nobile]|uniref:Uncharacterized protein n=1 Tax=Dendrobium nobile TaxID=94219 RepID=A0A8T3B2S3_DENNO|nr:hypothetical protein KFK09_014800 [Dendrobium nobile]